MVAFVALALAAALATSGPDSIARIPGATMSLGMPEARLKELGTFVEVKTDDAQGALARRGDATFFGVPCSATLYVRDGRLARVRFEVASVAPHSAAYVEDQLLRARLLRECRRLAPGDHDCDWIGAVKIHLELLADKLSATADWPSRPWEAEAPVAAATGALPDAATLAKKPAAPPPPIPATEPPATATPAKEHAVAETLLAKQPAEPAPAKAPEPAAPMPPPTQVSTPAPATATPAAKTAPASSKPAASATAPAVGTVAGKAPMPPTATLPETLRLSLPERNPPSVWPRMLALPALDYPEAARSKGVQGVVWVLALVDTAGQVRATRIDRGIPELNESALAWVTKARFAPCVRDGATLSFWIRVAVRFTLS